MVWDTAVAIDRISSDTIVVSYGLLDNYNTNPSPFGSGQPAYPCRAVSFDGGQTWPEVFEYDSVFGSMATTSPTEGTLTVTGVFNGSLKIGQSLFLITWQLVAMRQIQ